MGEDVPDRDYYTTKDSTGDACASTSASSRRSLVARANLYLGVSALQRRLHEVHGLTKPLARG